LLSSDQNSPGLAIKSRIGETALKTELASKFLMLFRLLTFGRDDLILFTDAVDATNEWTGQS